jgi:transposase
LFDSDPAQILGEWEGYDVEAFTRLPARGGKPLRIRIERSPGEDKPGRCSGCGRRVASVYETTNRIERDLPILEAKTHVVVPRWRLACLRCGPKLEKLSWLSPWGRVTKRLAESVARLCQVMAVKHVAKYFTLGWDRVKGIDKGLLRKRLGAVELSDVDEVLAMDEFAVQKGDRYATVIVEARQKQVLWVGRGCGREDIRPFFELLGRTRRTKNKGVTMDMNPAYLVEVRAQCPQAEIVYDLFHVVARYGREVIDRVRVEEANRVRNDELGAEDRKGFPMAAVT